MKLIAASLSVLAVFDFAAAADGIRGEAPDRLARLNKLRIGKGCQNYCPKFLFDGTQERMLYVQYHERSVPTTHADSRTGLVETRSFLVCGVDDHRFCVFSCHEQEGEDKAPLVNYNCQGLRTLDDLPADYNGWRARAEQPSPISTRHEHHHRHHHDHHHHNHHHHDDHNRHHHEQHNHEREGNDENIFAAEMPAPVQFHVQA